MKRTELTEMDYKGSGIKTLRGMATLMLILGIIGALSFIPLWSIEKAIIQKSTYWAFSILLLHLFQVSSHREYV